MNLDYSTIELLRQSHPAWRLLRSDHASLITGFLHRVFIIPNARMLAQADLAEMLEDELFDLRQKSGPETFPRSALEYLDEWASNEKGWLRKFYTDRSDEPYFDLTPSTEKAIAWIGTLTERSFVGTGSRLLTLFDLLKQMSEGSETDPKARIAELQKRRDEIDAEIARIESGHIPLLDDTALKERFQQFQQLARDLLTDFREVEQNFRELDRRVRERIALYEGGKGALLQQIVGDRDAITDSDQGRSFQAFWDFLMSSSRQEELTALLERVLALAPVAALRPDVRTRRVHYDWLEAGEHTLRTVARLSQQLRRFLDDRALLENRRIMNILQNIEARALALRQAPPAGTMMSVAETKAEIELPLERPLYVPVKKAEIAEQTIEVNEEDIDAAALFSQIVVNRLELAKQIRHSLQDRTQITLREICEEWPLTQGLAELVAYMQMTDDSFRTMVDENTQDEICWNGRRADGSECLRRARLPRILFVR